MMILSAVVLWIEPPDVIAASIRNGGSERFSQDPCLQSLFNLRKKLRNFYEWDSPVLQWVYRRLSCSAFNGVFDYWLTFWQPPEVNKVRFADCCIRLVPHCILGNFLVISSLYSYILVNWASSMSNFVRCYQTTYHNQDPIATVFLNITDNSVIVKYI